MFQFPQVPVRLFHFRFDYGAKGMLGNMCRRRCHVSESPELPTWVKCSPGENSTAEGSEDDFVLPSKFDSLDDRPGVRRGHDSGPTTGRLSCEAISDADADADADANYLSTILSSGFSSPDAVVRALDGCSVNVSVGLVDKMLKRYANDWVPAFGFFRWVETKSSYNHSTDSFDSMVDILGKSKKFDLMWSLTEQVVPGKLVSLSTMTRIMRRLARAGRWKDTIETFQNIEQFGVKKDTLAMNTLLDTLCKERSVMRARDIFFEVRNSIPPDASTFNILIHGWCKAGKLEEARWTMEEMKQSGFSPCVISYTSLIEAYCLDKNFRQVDAILEEMQGLCRSGKLRHSCLFFEKMVLRGFAPRHHTYKMLLEALEKEKLDKAKEDILKLMAQAEEKNQFA